jgi:hypothetical protein
MIVLLISYFVNRKVGFNRCFPKKEGRKKPRKSASLLRNGRHYAKMGMFDRAFPRRKGVLSRANSPSKANPAANPVKAAPDARAIRHGDPLRKHCGSAAAPQKP